MFAYLLGYSSQFLFALLCVRNQYVQAVAEFLHIGNDTAVTMAMFIKSVLELLQIRCSQLQTVQMEILDQFCRGANLFNDAFVDESDSVATFRFIEIRRGNRYRHALTGNCGKH